MDSLLTMPDCKLKSLLAVCVVHRLQAGAPPVVVRHVFFLFFFAKLRFVYNFLTVYTSVSSVVILLFFVLFLLAAFLRKN